MIEGSIDGYFDYLEEIGKLRIGDYEIFKEIFDEVNIIVILYIDVRLIKILEVF